MPRRKSGDESQDAEKNTGLEYEALTQAFFQGILDQSAVKNINVQRNVHLQGRTPGVTHQIDVYWEFEVGGVLFQAVVSCKDWRSKVKQAHVHELDAVLQDLPGQPRGIIVTREGFQSGALAAAKSRGISLYQLDEAGEDYWEGRIKTIVLNLRIVVPRVEDMNLEFDLDWSKAEKTRLGISRPIEITLPPRPPNRYFAENDDGTESWPLSEVLAGRFHFADSDVHPLESQTIEFDEPRFLKLDPPVQGLSRLKIKRVTAKVGQSLMQQKVVIDAGNLIRYVLRSFDTLDVYTADGELKVIRKESGTADTSPGDDAG